MYQLLLLSHSTKVVDGIEELINELTADVSIVKVAGMPGGNLGCNRIDVQKAFEQGAENGICYVLFDVGSTLMVAEEVWEELDEAAREKVFILDAPLVEGAIQISLDIQNNREHEEIMNALKPLHIGKKY